MTNTKGSAVLAFLAGGVIGAGVALLFAPYTGSETRRKIREGVEDTGDWAKDRLNDTKNRIEEGTGKVKQMISDKKSDIEAAYEAGKDAFYKGKERLLKETAL